MQLRRALSSAGLGLALGLLSSPAYAAACSSAYPGAESSPAPWAGDPTDAVWAGTCFVDLGSDPNVYRETLEAQCRSIPGFVQFNADRGSGHNTCTFRPTGGNAVSSPRRAQGASPQIETAPAPAAPSSSPYVRPRRTTPIDLSWAPIAVMLSEFPSVRHFTVEEMFCAIDLTTDKQTMDIGNLLTDSNLAEISRKCVNAQNNTLNNFQRNVISENISKTKQSGGKSSFAPAFDKCIETVNSRQISNSCEFKEGVPMFEVQIRIDPNAPYYENCPREMTVGYAASGEPGMGRFDIAPSYRPLWTCGGPALEIHAVE